MKKLFVPASALLVLFASCSKDNNSPKPPANSQLIQGSWNGVSIVKRGFAKGVAIGSDSSLTPVFKTAILTFRPTSVADSITGTAGTDHSTIVTGTYVIGSGGNKDSITAVINNLGPVSPNTDNYPGITGTAAPLTVAGLLSVSDTTSFAITRNARDSVYFGTQQSDSSVTVVKFIRAKVN